MVFGILQYRVPTIKDDGTLHNNGTNIYLLQIFNLCSTGFSLFNVVKFKHDQCISTSTYPSGFSRDGTCLTESKCEERNGTAFGSCASG